MSCWFFSCFLKDLFAADITGELNYKLYVKFNGEIFHCMISRKRILRQICLEIEFYLPYWTRNITKYRKLSGDKLLNITKDDKYLRNRCSENKINSKNLIKIFSTCLKS